VVKKSHGTSTIQKVKKTKIRAIDNASQRTIMIASVDATHTRAESAEGKGETIVGAKEIATWLKKERNTRVKLAAKTAA
jgi:predicted class III extradiol MEMO1 family dioxygenase